MAIINLTPLIDALGGNTATGATGTITAVVMAGGVPATRINGSGVIMPVPVTDTFTDGVLTNPLELDVLPEGYYWKFTICVGEVCHIYYFTVAADCDFDELNFIDPTTLAPIVNPTEKVQYFPTVGMAGENIDAWYVKLGNLVTFSIAVDFSGVTAFGTGQVNIVDGLPFAPMTGHYAHFSGWCNYDPSADPDVVGHYIINADYRPDENQTIDLHYLKAGPANSAIKEALFTRVAPATLTTASRLYVTGTYITEVI